MIRDLLSRLCAGLCTPKWLNLPLLIAMLMPLCTHAAALPDGAPDYEFSVDNVTYKCYFRLKYESTNPTPNDKGTKYYTVYALPENTNITHAAIRLDFSWDLENYIPTDEPGYRPCAYYNPTTQLVDGAWDGCTSLKWLELIADYWDDYENRNTTDLAPISDLSLLNIFVTGEKKYSWDRGEPYQIFKNRNSNANYYSDMDIYSGSRYNYGMRASSIGTFANSLLVENKVDLDMDKYNESGMTLKVEVSPRHLTDSRYYPISYDNDGKHVEPLIGNFGYKVSINELVGQHKPYSGNVYNIGSDIFNDCFDVKNGEGYEILTPNDAKTTEYGYTGIRITTDSYRPEDIERDSDGTYFLQQGGYDFYFTYDGMEMRYSHIVYSSDLADYMVELEATEWLPHRVTVAATELECDMSNLEDGAVLGIGEYDDSGKLTFTPFDEQKKAVLYDYENSFETSHNFSGENTNGEIKLQFRKPVYLVLQVKGRNIKLSDGMKLTQPETSYLKCPVKRYKQKIEFNFRQLLVNGMLSEGDKVGIIYDDKKYYAGGSSEGACELVFDDLFPNRDYYIKVFYEIDGQQFTSKWNSIIKTLSVGDKYEMNASTHTQSITFNFPEISYDESYGDVVFEDLAVYLDGKTRYDDAEFEITTQKDIRISNLQIWENYELRGYCRYIRKSDGEKTTLFPIKIYYCPVKIFETGTN